MNLAELDHLDELAAMAYGWSVMEQADEILRIHAEMYQELDAYWYAEKYAQAQAWLLDDIRLCSHGTREENQGLLLQSRWWTDVARELKDRKGEVK
jgi:hypothetical protein